MLTDTFLDEMHLLEQLLQRDLSHWYAHRAPRKACREPVALSVPA